MSTDFGIDLDSILDVFEEEKKEPIESVETPPYQKTEIVEVEVQKVRNRVRENCPHCGKELSMYAGHPTVHWYCFPCMCFVRDNEIKE
jgi:ribosomal protein S27AE